MTPTQEKNIAWYLPRPKRDRYKGGMPLWCEELILRLGRQLLCNEDARILNLFCGMINMDSVLIFWMELNLTFAVMHMN